MNKIPMTAEGFNRLREELKRLKTVDRPAIIRAIAGLGNALGIPTTAEGVETVEQLDVVRRAGCSEVQGYLISPPCYVSQLPGLIARLRQRAAAAA